MSSWVLLPQVPTVPNIKSIMRVLCACIVRFFDYWNVLERVSSTNQVPVDSSSATAHVGKLRFERNLTTWAAALLEPTGTWFVLKTRSSSQKTSQYLHDALTNLTIVPTRHNIDDFHVICKPCSIPFNSIVNSSRTNTTLCMPQKMTAKIGAKRRAMDDSGDTERKEEEMIQECPNVI